MTCYLGYLFCENVNEFNLAPPTFKLIIDFTERTADLRKEDHPHISKLCFYWSTLSQPPNRERERESTEKQHLKFNKLYISIVTSRRGDGEDGEGGKKGEFERANRGRMSLEESSLKIF